MKQPEREICELSVNSYIRNKNTEGNLSQLNAEDFINLIEHYDILLPNGWIMKQASEQCQNALELFLAKSGASAHCVNTMANMGLCITYQTAFNRINRISNEHQISVKKYIQAHIRAITKKLETEELSISKKIVHLVPFLGPLYVSLNIRETIIIVFHSFFDYFYKAIFKKKQKLAIKPRPWQINLLLYLVHEGWLLVKKYITKSFETSKNIAYITFLDLLDNLIPAALDIYMHLFHENHFEEYINIIFQLWTIMRRFQRHNYDKI
ncbi:20975_t:CDS:2, partial [Cetraspora pellucida]